MKIAIYVCDRCKGEIREPDKPFLFRLFAERKFCALASVARSPENWYYESDLCPNCVVSLADHLMKMYDNGMSAEAKLILAKEFKAKKQ